MENQLKKVYEVVSNQIGELETILETTKADKETIVEYKKKLKELKKIKKELKKML